MRKNTKNSIKLVLTLVALITYFLPWITSWPDSATIWYAGDSLRMLGGLTGSSEAQAVGVVMLVCSAIAVLFLLFNGYKALRAIINANNGTASTQNVTSLGLLIALLNTIIMAILIMVTGKETYNVWTVSAWPIISAIACLLGIFF